MIIILHVIIALTSIVLTTITFLRPSKTILGVGYGFVGLTLISGFYLVLSSPAHMIQACTSGLIYLAITSVGIVAANIKLSKLIASSGKSDS